MFAKVRTRFAPSPTGSFHLGSARTALYAYLFAKKAGGDFVLRMEDTDLARSTQESANNILSAMEWLGLDYDEGPIYQSKCFERYQVVAKQLLAEGKAYKCYCSQARIDELRHTQMQNKEKPRYDGKCRNLSSEQAGEFVVRFKNPETGEVRFQDGTRKEVSFANAELDDLIMVRGNGVPTYNFTVVIDDWDMQISHVIRGDDHLNNTPRQINLLKALGAPIPNYIHLPMILGQDGKRLSKRHGALGVVEYQAAGYLPEAMLNYLVRLGWSHGNQEIFSRAEMINLFDLEHLSHAPASFDAEKLLWTNQHFMHSKEAKDLAPILKSTLSMRNIEVNNTINLEALAMSLQTRAKTMVEMADKAEMFFLRPKTYNLKAVTKCIKAETINLLHKFAAKLEIAKDWQLSTFQALLSQFLIDNNCKLGDIGQGIRIALSGNTSTPPLDQTLAIMGQEECLHRIQVALKSKDFNNHILSRHT